MSTPTRSECLSAAGAVLARARARRDSLTPRAAAEAAYRTGGPSVDEIEARIRELRGMAPAVQRAA